MNKKRIDDHFLLLLERKGEKILKKKFEGGFQSEEIDRKVRVRILFIFMILFTWI